MTISQGPVEKHYTPRPLPSYHTRFDLLHIKENLLSRSHKYVAYIGD